MELSPLVILIIGIVAVLGMIMILRVNAFIALITAAMLVSLLSPGALSEKITRVACTGCLANGRLHMELQS